MSAPAGSENAVHLLGVAGAARAIAAGTLTPTDLLEGLLDRLDTIEGRVQAWCHLDADAAREEAAALTKEAAAGARRGPLHGIPFGVKDIFHVRGMPTLVDPLVPEGEPQPEDSGAVARLRAAGAVILGKLYVPGGRGRPPTRNPWDLERNPGGSSTGSGAAAGALMVPFTLGEQTAGSGLRPAAYCGAAALKPSFGRISRYRMMLNAWSLDHVVIMARTTEDVSLVYAALAGADPRDPSTLLRPTPPPAPLSLDGYRPPRIAVLHTYYVETAEPVMQRAVEAATQQLGQAGARIRDVALPREFDMTWQVHGIIMHTERNAVRARAGVRTGGGGRASAPERTRTLSIPPELAALVPAPYYLQARRLQRWLQERMLQLFDDADLLLTPTAEGPAPLYHQGTGDNSFLVPWSLLGYPTLTVPCGLSPEGMPLGLQLIGRPGEDDAVLRAGAWCEGILGRLPPPPIG